MYRYRQLAAKFLTQVIKTRVPTMKQYDKLTFKIYFNITSISLKDLPIKASILSLLVGEPHPLLIFLKAIPGLRF